MEGSGVGSGGCV